MGYDDKLLLLERFKTLSILKESVRHNRNVFTVLTDLVSFATCFGQLGSLQVIQTAYEILTRRLLAYNTVQKNEASVWICLHYCVMSFCISASYDSVYCVLL